MQKDSASSTIIRFSTFELDVRAGELRKQGVKIKLQEQPLRILEMLLAHPGQLVTREELRGRLWPSHTFVDFEHGLNKAINKLREALGDSAESPRFVETLAKRGYRFLADLAANPSQIRSILVLPLDNLSGDPEQEYFAVGMTEALMTHLAKISALRVISRTTAIYYKRVQKPLPEIAREIGVDGVIEGSVLRAEGRVRISAQLLHAPTDTHLWADSYDRDVRDLLALQAEVASAIVREIQVKVTPHEQTQLARAPVVNPHAYDACLRGRYYWSQRTLEGYRRAIQCFEQAIALDPRFARAYAGLADCYGLRGWYGIAPPEEGCAKAKKLALQAIEIDPSAAEPHASLAWVAQYWDYDFATAEREFRRAIELDPLYIIGHYWFSLSLSWMGRFEEAIAEAKHAIDLDPISATANPFLDMAYLCSRQYELMAAHSRRTIELYPNSPVSHWALGWASLELSNFELAIAELKLAVECSGRATLFLALLAEAHAVAGNRDEARRMLEQLLENSIREYVTPYMIGRIHAALGEKDEAFRSLEAAYRERAAWMPFLKVDPRMDGLRSDRRFEELLRRMSFPPVVVH
jgi:TolB-like protein/Tfp pilus assembly protein PilF